MIAFHIRISNTPESMTANPTGGHAVPVYGEHGLYYPSDIEKIFLYDCLPKDINLIILDMVEPNICITGT